ncbi:MAG: porin family protein [Bacteroidota bacterium]
MRRICLLVGTMLVFFHAQSQVRISLKVSPSVAANRVTSSSDTLSFTSNGVGGRFTFGPVIDIPFQENYFISTGIIYAPKRASFEMFNRNTDSRTEESYNLQYLQIPLTMKLLTNEVALDKRIYVQLGGLLEFNVNEKPNSANEVFVTDFRAYDFSFHIGSGLEFKLGTNTGFFAGFSYTRGLVNAVATELPFDDELSIKNDLLSLDFGVKF